LNYVKQLSGEEFYTGTVEDISKQRITEQALVTSELKYRRIFENLQDIYFEAKLDGTISELNSGIKKISGYNREELLGKNLNSFFFDEKKSEYLINYLIGNNSISDFEVRIKSIQLNYIVCSINAMIINDEISGQLRIIGSLRDITYRKQNELMQLTMFQIANAANNSVNTKELYSNIIELLCKYISADNALLALIDDSSQSISFPYIKDYPAIKRDFPAIHSYSKHIIKSNESIIWDKNEISVLMKDNKIEPFLKIPNSILAVPILSDNIVIGLISLISYNESICFYENDLNLVYFASNQLSLSNDKLIKNEEINKLNSELENKVIERTAELKNAYNELKRENLRRKNVVKDLEKTKFELEIALENGIIIWQNNPEKVIHF